MPWAMLGSSFFICCVVLQRFFDIVLFQAAIFEVLYRPQTSLNIIINEYLNTSDFFLEESQKKYLNAILDKISKKIRS